MKTKEEIERELEAARAEYDRLEALEKETASTKKDVESEMWRLEKERKNYKPPVVLDRINGILDIVRLDDRFVVYDNAIPEYTSFYGERLIRFDLKTRSLGGTAIDGDEYINLPGLFLVADYVGNALPLCDDSFKPGIYKPRAYGNAWSDHGVILEYDTFIKFADDMTVEEIRTAIWNRIKEEFENTRISMIEQAESFRLGAVKLDALIKEMF